jgi:radical SAM superfamily enzyme YgiQ (UPF0313 family)
MKILLMSPLMAPGRRTHRSIRIPQLTLHLIKSITPGEHDVQIIEEELEEIDVEADCDLVGITCLTTNALRSYDFADELRRRGKIVVMGGIHPTALPDEALLHCDAVVIGEAENVWDELLEDAAGGRLKKKYFGTPVDLEKLPVIKLPRIDQNAMGIVPIMTTRGCPYDCSFCSATSVFGKKIRHVPVSDVIEYIRINKLKRVMFLDDNIIGHKKYARELFTALMPLGIDWVGNASISVADDPDFLNLIAGSGCHAFFMGLETIMPDSATGFKKAKSPAETANAIRTIMKAGIKVHASMIFGFDTDDGSVFEKTVDFLMKTKVHSISFNILTPFPGTALFEQYEREGRMISRDWSKFEFDNVVFTPRCMTPDELTRGVFYARKRFNSLASMVRRFPANMRMPLVYLAMNAAFYRNSKREWKEYLRSCSAQT